MVDGLLRLRFWEKQRARLAATSHLRIWIKDSLACRSSVTIKPIAALLQIGCRATILSNLDLVYMSFKEK